MMTCHSKKKRKWNPPVIISEKLRKEVINFWETQHNNTIPDIMNEFNLKESTAHSIINRYFGERFNK